MKSKLSVILCLAVASRLAAQIDVTSAGNVGIGTTTPGGVGGTTLMVNTPSYGSAFRIKDSGVANGDFGFLVSAYGAVPLFRIFDFAHGTDRMAIDSNGNVGIGTITPGYKLEVAGSVRATSFISSTTTYADFVFKPGYKLASLSETEAAIQRDGHLPGIPSEAEAKEHGIDLSAMQVKLLQKVEELTLHQIEQEKRIQKLEEENARLRTRP